MLPRCIKWLLCILFLCWNLSYGQVFKTHGDSYETHSPLPFPSCHADNIDCLRRGLRTFFILMDAGHLGMRPVDPSIVNSVVVALPEQRVSFLLRRVNVTGAKWTKLVERRFQLRNFMNGVIFNSDLHVEGEILMSIANRTQPRTSYITMDIRRRACSPPDGKWKLRSMDIRQPNIWHIAVPTLRTNVECLYASNFTGYLTPKLEHNSANTAISRKVNGPDDATFSPLPLIMSTGLLLSINRYLLESKEIESNITYSWSGTNYNNDDYILIGPERIAVRNRRTPTYFLQPGKTTDARIIDNMLQLQPSILDHFTNEIVTALMHSVVENFRLFARKVPVKYYYDYSSFIL